MTDKSIAKMIGGAVLAIVVLVLLFNSFSVVNAGQVGIKTRLGSIASTLGPGLHLKTPFIERIVKINVQTQKESASAEAASSDLQTVNTKIAVNYNINPAKAADLYSKVGTDYQTVIIDPAIQEVVKGVTAKYTAEQLITERPAVTNDIQSQLTTELATNYVIVSAVSITNFDFSDQFNQAIEAKVTAQQNAEAAKNKLAQVQYEAQQTTTQAQADADAIKIKAEAINSQGGADYVQLQAISKWDGHLPAQMVPGSTVPFINLTK